MILITNKPSTTLLLVIIALSVSLWVGCQQNHMKTSSQSVSALLTKLPNLKLLSVESCTFTFETNTGRSAVPSPSDTRVEVVGSAILSTQCMETLRSQFQWLSSSKE